MYGFISVCRCSTETPWNRPRYRFFGRDLFVERGHETSIRTRPGDTRLVPRLKYSSLYEYINFTFTARGSIYQYIRLKV